MRFHWITAIALAAVMSFAMQSLAEEQEKKIERSGLPPAVEKIVAAQSQASNHSRLC